MKHRHCPAGISHQAVVDTGITLLELLVAIAMATLVMSITFTAWRFTARHIAVSRRKLLFHSETENFARSITKQIRQSPSICGFDDHEIRFVHAETGDTLHYRYEWDTFFRNDSAVSLAANTARITGFSVSRFEQDELVARRYILLKLSFSMEDEYNNSSSLTLFARVREPSDEYNRQVDGIDDW